MASYHWTYIDSSVALARYTNRRYGLTGTLRARAYELLADGLPFELGELWYMGEFRYRIRYTERVDYPLRFECMDDKSLHIEMNNGGYWVMSKIGSVHSVPFLTLETAEKYKETREKEIERNEKRNEKRS